MGVSSTGFLLDTHVVVWLVTNPGRLRPVVLDALADSRRTLFVSAISERLSPATAAQERGSARCCGKEWMWCGSGARSRTDLRRPRALPRHHADPGQSGGHPGEKGPVI